MSYYLYRSRYNFIIDYVVNKEFDKINRYDNEEVIKIIYDKVLKSAS